MATHSSILAWRIPWTEEPGRLQSMASQESDMTRQLTHHHHMPLLERVFLIPTQQMGKLRPRDSSTKDEIDQPLIPPL